MFLNTLYGVLLVSVLTAPGWIHAQEAANPNSAKPNPAKPNPAKPNPGGPSTSEQVVKALFVRQTASGLPGQDPTATKPGAQLIWLSKDRLKMLDRGKTIYLLDAANETGTRLWVLSNDGSQYRDGADLSSIQSDRDQFEKQTIANEKDDATLESLHIRRDGKRKVTIETETLEEKLLDFPVKRYVVRENGRVIVDAKVTEAIESPGPFFRFYRHAGAFSKEVLEKLETIPGLPLEANILVVTASMNYEISAKVDHVELMDFPARLLALPDKAERLETGPVVACPICGLKAEREGAPVAKKDGREYRFDRDECFEIWRERRLEEIRKKRRAKPGR